ncbi:UNVERIFIED_CONTAM: hypothetical protein HDU68_011785 [Siphonaria sp. JEL0065]|nr:hypothetical protein HDU68_011785 [Siphonaria sp. JEL0065]
MAPPVIRHKGRTSSKNERRSHGLYSINQPMKKKGAGKYNFGTFKDDVHEFYNHHNEVMDDHDYQEEGALDRDKQYKKRLAGSGLDQASMDRRYSNLGADEIGLAKAGTGTRIWSLYKSNILPISQLTQAESKVLSAAIVKKWEEQEETKRNQLRRVTSPNAEWMDDIRDWDSDEMAEYFLVKLGGVVPSTGMKMTPENISCDGKYFHILIAVGS